MNRFRTLIPALLCLAAPLAAQADESRCRSVDSNLWASAYGRGTATGKLQHVITLRDCYGNVVASDTVENWMNTLSIYPIIRAVEVHSGGQVSIRFNYWAFTAFIDPDLPGGTVEIRNRYGALIDRDRLR